jgi:hypothetical protein
MEISREEYMKMQLAIFDLTTKLQDADKKAEEKFINNLLYAKDETVNKIIQRAIAAETELSRLKERFDTINDLNKQILKDQKDTIDKAYNLAILHEEMNKRMEDIR